VAGGEHIFDLLEIVYRQKIWGQVGHNIRIGIPSHKGKVLLEEGSRAISK